MQVSRRWQTRAKMKTRFKDWPKVYERIKGMRGMTQKEKVLLAQGLAATPEERLKMHDDRLRSLGLYSHWDRVKAGFNAADFRSVLALPVKALKINSK